jgi:hypothetical protein
MLFSEPIRIFRAIRTRYLRMGAIWRVNQGRRGTVELFHPIWPKLLLPQKRDA